MSTSFEEKEKLENDRVRGELAKLLRELDIAQKEHSVAEADPTRLCNIKMD